MICSACGEINSDENKFCLKCGATLNSSVEGNITRSPVAFGEQLHELAKGQLDSFVLQKGGAKVSGLSTFNIWGPFAGYGTRRRHESWLMDGQGARANELVENVNKGFRKREIPNAGVKRSVLVGQGVLVEERPYFILRKGLTRIGLYITNFGQDLFVSMVSYIKPPISNIRVLFAGLMITLQLFMSFGFPILLSDSFNRLTSGFNLFGGGSTDMSGLLSLFCIVGPVGGLNSLALLLLLIYSLYKWFTEKDLWAALRVPPDEFDEDDLMAMEKAVEQTVLSSLDEIGLNAEDLLPALSIPRRRFI
jgi:hypothetical protein